MKQFYFTKEKNTYTGQKVINSMMGGKTIESVEEATAPTNEMNRPILGMAAAKMTANRTLNLDKILDIFFLNSLKLNKKRKILFKILHTIIQIKILF